MSLIMPRECFEAAAEEFSVVKIHFNSKKETFRSLFLNFLLIIFIKDYKDDFD